MQGSLGALGISHHAAASTAPRASRPAVCKPPLKAARRTTVTARPSRKISSVVCASPSQVTTVVEPEVAPIGTHQATPSAEQPNNATFSTTGDANVHGTAGAVFLDHKAQERADPVRNIVFVSSEAAPWSKTGGLGDVIGSLPAALAARGHRVMVVLPRYAQYEGVSDTGKRQVLLGHAEVGYFHLQSRGVDWVFVDHPSYPRPGGIYADQYGPYGDNQFRFSLLCLAALEAPLVLDLPLPPQQWQPEPEELLASASSSNGNTAGQQGAPEGGEDGAQDTAAQVPQVPYTRYGQDCVFIANDWHASLVPVYLAAKYRPHGVYWNARSVLAIHNLRHQGVFPPYSYDSLGLPPHWYGCLEWQYPPHQRQGSWAEEGRSVNHLKAGISTADRILTVSAGYAEEIKTYLGGWGMEGLLEQRGFVLNGIVNGIDVEEWNPASDPHLAANYGLEDFVEGKKKCKLALQRELGLPEDPDIPLFAFIGRLDPQKGADILLEAAANMLPHHRMQLVCLGSGTPDLENGLRWLEGAFRDKARGWVGFNVPFSHRLTAAADILLMPSRFEPCGLNQLYAMRYGAVPIAHKTGGLKDTVLDYDPWAQKGTGWTYTDCSAAGLSHCMGMALLTYYNHREDFHKLQRRGMERECSWDNAAQQYEQIFTWAVQDRAYCN